MNKREALIDTAGCSGAGLVAYGAWLIYPPAGFIVGGVLLLVAAWMLSGAPKKQPEVAG